ncbi:helix-turn-helix domain-containing protein [Hyphomicrobium sp. LHD-15]|uniref:helix-turn-helix transcriptional regulator n=1 Tax=Hyphomicrobium sp. LHD-15 TaxID=3072142 RepID=UPI00280FD121|nr:helix-turn-helix domain-containing protein [Hyphomicrobium sp. LHD-15]MDQ8698158.1 helix-turn-helix domain-containing protein [Hyphomicrobium sp. LHD-15]
MDFENCVRHTAAKYPLGGRFFPGSYEDADGCFEAMAAGPSAPSGGGGGSQDKPSDRGSPANVPVFLTSIEVAHMLRLSPKTLEKMRLEKRGPEYFRLGNAGRAKVIYRLADVEEWLAKLHRPSVT